jgi:hypothetical protein
MKRLQSDLHTDRTAAEAIVQRASAVDILVGAGDFASVRRDLADCIDILRAVDRPTVLIVGNNESTDEWRAACRGWSAAHLLHRTGVMIGRPQRLGADRKTGQLGNPERCSKPKVPIHQAPALIPSPSLPGRGTFLLPTGYRMLQRPVPGARMPVNPLSVPTREAVQQIPSSSRAQQIN